MTPGVPTEPGGILVPRDELLVEIGIGEIAIAEAPKRIMTPALGSCVGLAIWDSFTKRGGLAHIMLPTSVNGSARPLPGKCADTAVLALVRMLRDAGSLRVRLGAKIAGGAAMFRGDGAGASVGERNIQEVKRQLALMSVPLLAEDTGEAHARTVELVLETGELIVRSYRFGVKRL